MENLLFICGIITAVGGAFAVVSRAIKPLMHKIEQVDEISKKIEGLSGVVRKLEIVNLIHHNPKNEMTICKLYDQYKKDGYNSYIDELFSEWKEKL
jgi:hypothetical protein